MIYNSAGVHTNTKKDSQIIFMDADFNAKYDVNVLASAFNMDKAQFMGQRVLIDSFGSIDRNRLALLFANEPNYTALTSTELTALDAIPAVIVDGDWFMIYDNMNQFTEDYNGEGLYWQYWYHAWKTFSISPFANAAVFVPGAPSITSVTVSPETAVLMPGQSLLLSATVVTANFASKAVNWTATVGGEAVPDKISISPLGVLTVAPDITEGTEITVTATSVFDSTKSDTATITVYDSTP